MTISGNLLTIRQNRIRNENKDACFCSVHHSMRQVNTMIELHGWLTVQETAGDEDLLTPQERDSINRQIEDVLRQADCGLGLLCRNGQRFLSTLYCGNHRTPQVDAVIAVYRRIAEIAAGSYGMLCIRDDEDSLSGNAFQVMILRRGQAYWRLDTDFSPCIPVIEDDLQAAEEGAAHAV